MLELAHGAVAFQTLGVDIRVGPDPAQRTAVWITRRLRDAVRRRGAASLALSGGSSAPPMIDALIRMNVPWEAVEVWQVDERVAPNGHEARNANQLRELSTLAKVHLMPVTSPDLRSAARRYSSSLPDRFDVVHLGLGDDGHTASWPPGDVQVRDSRRSVELVAPFHGWPRMTLTRRVLNRARSRVVLTTGDAKRPMIERWLLADPTIPATALRRSGTWVFLDQSAAPTGRLHPAAADDDRST